MTKTSYGEILCVEHIQWLLYCIVSLHLYSTSCSAHQSEALPVQKTHRERERAVLRERKEALGSPVSKVDRVDGRSSLCHTELVQISHRIVPSLHELYSVLT